MLYELLTKTIIAKLWRVILKYYFSEMLKGQHPFTTYGVGFYFRR
jgi:hypothetical protein